MRTYQYFCKPGIQEAKDKIPVVAFAAAAFAVEVVAAVASVEAAVVEAAAVAAAASVAAVAGDWEEREGPQPVAEFRSEDRKGPMTLPNLGGRPT